jgi:hypothetical protein
MNLIASLAVLAASVALLFFGADATARLENFRK